MTPPSLQSFCDTILPLMLRQADGRRMLDDVSAIVETDRWNSFDKFHETTKTLVQKYEVAGAQAEVYPIQTGGAIDTGRWIIQEAADVLGATVDVVHPVEQRLLDYKDNPWHVIQWSAGTPRDGLTCELVVVDSAEELEKTPRGGLNGKIVLTKMSHRGLLRKLDATGAVGIITDVPQAHLPDATAWIKFGWGQIPRTEDPARLVGLVISENEGRSLRALQAQHGKLTLRVCVEVRKYVGTHDLVSGIITGRDDPQDEIWVLAHSAEPGAADNASGVAICLEIARIIEGLIAEGLIPRPRRTIRLLNAYECYGFFHYMEHAKRFQTPVAGVCLDTLAMLPSVCDGRLSWRATVPMSAGFVDRVGEVMLRSVLDMENPGYTLHTGPFVATSDTLAGDPQYGFPCPWLTTHYRDIGVYHAYHSSADTIELLSPQGLAVCAVAMAGYLYYLADAGSDEVMELATMETDRTVSLIETGSEGKAAPTADYAAVASRPVTPEDAAYLREAHHVTIEQLKRWMWGNGCDGTLSRTAVLTHLFNCEDRMGKVAANTGSPLVPDTAFGSNLVPYRTAFLSPSPANTPAHMDRRISGGGLMAWAVFRADGRRTIAEIAASLSCEYQRKVAVEDVVSYFEGLAELGYVKLVDPEKMISRDRLVDDLRTLGLTAGMDVMVHSSLSSIGYVVGGADTVVDALLAAIGPEGTLLMPSFNHGAARVYNPLTTPTTNGAIPDAMWRRPDAVRSMHPTHAVAAIGPNAEAYCRGHLDIGVWAPESPIGRLIHGGGYILSIGVTHNTTTAHHVAEMSVPCGCIDPFGNTDRIVTDDGRVREVRGLAFRSGPCPVSPDKLHDTLSERRLERYGTAGHALCSLVKAIDLWHVRREHLKDICPTCTLKPNIRKE